MTKLVMIKTADFSSSLVGSVAKRRVMMKNTCKTIITRQRVMMKNMFMNEWKGFVRNRIFLSLILIFIASLVLVTWLGVVQNNKLIEAQRAAHEAMIQGVNECAFKLYPDGYGLMQSFQTA